MADNKARVAVGCKLPHGLLLHLDREGVDGDGGGKRFFRQEDAEPVKLNGVYQNGDGLLHPAGYGLTMVDKEFWDAWVAQKKSGDGKREHPLLASGMIFAEPTKDRLESKGTELDKVETGLEGVKTDDPNSKVKPFTKDE